MGAVTGRTGEPWLVAGGGVGGHQDAGCPLNFVDSLQVPANYGSLFVGQISWDGGFYECNELPRHWINRVDG